jgi:poly(hydroxyalkanoate) depolymerase family esterase
MNRTRTESLRMSHRIPAGMAEAMRLTNAGKLTEATALIQQLLQGAQHSATEPSHAGPRTIIDIEHVRVDAPAPSDAGRGTAFAKPRTGLGETLQRLAADARASGFAGTKGIAPRPAPDPLPDGASFIEASFANDAGMRSYKLYIPANRPAGPLPLIVMLHGCTQSPDDFAAGTRMNAAAEEAGCYVAYPGQPASANPRKCWNWFEPGDQQRGAGEPSLIAGLTRQIMRDHDVDPSRVYIAGLSAGGAAAAVIGAAYPEIYAAIGVHSGLPAGAASDLPSALAAMRQGADAGTVHRHRIPTIAFHGDADPIVHPRNGDAVLAQATASGKRLLARVERGQARGGHSYTRTIHEDAAGRAVKEQWTIHGGGHAWAGGSAAGSYTDPHGPDATREMLRFFLTHRLDG